MRTTFKYLFVFFFLSLLFLGFSKNSEAIEFNFLGGRPANPDPDIPNSSSWFIYNLDKGEKKEDVIFVMNSFDEDLDIIIYSADGVKSSSGGFALNQLAEENTKVGSWVKFYPEPIPAEFEELFKENGESVLKFCSLNVENNRDVFDKWCAGIDVVEMKIETNQGIDIPFIFSVPEDAEVGEHIGGILIQKTQAEKDLGETQGISITTRVGVRIYQTVPGDILKEMKLKSFKAVKDYKEFDYKNFFSRDRKPETITLTTEVENLGNVSVDFEEVVTIKDESFDKRTEEIKGRGFQVLREDIFISNYSWNNPRFGKFTFLVNIKYVDQDGNPQNITSDVITFRIMPWREIVLALAVLLIILVPIATVKIIRKKKYSGKGWFEYTVRSGQSFDTIVNNIDVHWKIFAKTNRLKPPYALRAGQKILIPPKKIRK